MNTSQAKETLLRYRGPIDDADPQFEEALAYARRDPELAQWDARAEQLLRRDPIETS